MRCSVQKATESDRHKQVNTKYRKYGEVNADVNGMQCTLHKVQKQQQHKQWFSVSSNNRISCALVLNRDAPKQRRRKRLAQRDKNTRHWWLYRHLMPSEADNTIWKHVLWSLLLLHFGVVRYCSVRIIIIIIIIIVQSHYFAGCGGNCYTSSTSYSPLSFVIHKRALGSHCSFINFNFIKMWPNWEHKRCWRLRIPIGEEIEREKIKSRKIANLRNT